MLHAAIIGKFDNDTRFARAVTATSIAELDRKIDAAFFAARLAGARNIKVTKF